ncbi:MAG: hypothetical protein HOO92_06105 [Methylococcaceae bacterium]|nr:hypothetical protein [Methylococcaceae bacterium]
MYHVPRTCTEKKIDEGAESRPRQITDFRERAAYVLLGEPGAGKTSLFKEEADNSDNGLCISARDFIDLDRNEWRDKTLFIDGLDEARAGKDDARTPLGAIRGKLSQLDCKCFRISCREADWLGSPDANDLAKISPNQAITILHLNPLSSDDINQILHNDQRISDAQDFIEKSGQFGLSGLLENPQTLDMLINAVKGGNDWPSSKQEVYALACKQLASEFNDDHAVTQLATIPQLIEAAGFLCAVQLIANISGFTKGQASEGRLSLKDLTIPNDLPIHAALKTRLFNKTVNNEFSYVHRSVAEYLAAKFIANKIKEGLLFYRVQALTTGFDGGIVAALRGLMAWLSVHSEQASERLIQIDPVGVVINGDALLFPRPAKSQLFHALIREAKSTGFPNRDWHTSAFSAITTRDMADELIEILNRPSRSDGEQFLLHCLLRGLSCSEPIAEIKASLLTIIRDNSYWEGTRSHALYAFLHQYPEDLDSLFSLADDIRQGKVEDTENSLMDSLLDKLFPSKISASNIFQYLLLPKNNRVISYHYFWRDELPKRLSENDLALVLDQLFELGPDFLQLMPHEVVVDTAGQILIRGLQVHGLNIGSERLYSWLSIGINQYENYMFPLEQRQQICSWLDSHPDLYQAIIGAGLKQIKNFENINWEIHKIFLRLHGATPPNNLAQWWLNQALSETNFKLSCCYFEQALATLFNRQGNSGLSLDYFDSWLVDHPEYLETYQNLIYCVIPDWRFEHTNSAKAWVNQRDEEQSKKLSYLHEHQAQIADGSAPPRIFNQLAIAFNHLVQTNDKSREERLSEFLNGDVILIASAKTGLRKILQRTDLPTPNEVFKSAAKNGEYHYIRLPFLVCMDTLYHENPAMLKTLSDDLLSKALAFCFTEGASNEAWLKSLCQSKPELVSRLLIDYVSVLLAAKSQIIHGLHNLAYDQDFQKIAKLTIMPLLNKYPVRGYKNHVTHLHYLLDAAIANIDRQDLLTMIEKKLACKGMDLAQRIYWLATGLVIAPYMYEAKIKQTVLGKSERINRLSYFLYPSFVSLIYDRYDFPISTRGMLIEVLAPRCNPVWPRGGGTVTRAMEESNYVQFLLNSLAYNPIEDSAAILTGLLSQSKLNAWHTQIQSAQQTQQLSRREALFKHPNAPQVINTLSNSKPANVADLAALTVDCLEQLAKEMHGSNTDSYKHFWNVDKFNKPLTPRPENSCRNYLLERLKALLAKYDVQVDLEAHQAKDKRADMKMSFTSGGKTFHLPVEIKRDYHKDLWNAIHKQLIPLYTTAPETEGRGLFLVIWFNHEKLPTHPQGLPQPKSAEQLASMLKDTMTPQEQKLIDIFVLDVSKK